MSDTEAFHNETMVQQLVAEAQEGDSESFAALYDGYVDSVYRFASFRLMPELAEDVTAEIFIKAWEKLGSYKPQKGIPFRAWLFRIARYSVIDAYRAQRDIVAVPEDFEDENTLNRADTSVLRNDVINMVRNAMKQMPTRYREILELAYMANLPNDEIARILNIRQATVRVVKFRALSKLENLLPNDIQSYVQV